MAIIAKNPDSVNTVTIKISTSKSVDIGALASIDLLNEERTKSELASSEDLAEKIKDRIIIINDGTQDLDWLHGLDLVKDYHSVTQSDALGRWIVRTESRRENWDTVFQGAGDDLSTGIEGEGIPFLFDFSAPVEDTRWVTTGVPAGYKQQSIKWNFFDPVYIKEGTIYYYNMLKGSYFDFYIAVPQGYPYSVKIADSEFNVSRAIQYCTVPYLRFSHWVIHYFIEGNTPMGDELNTEAAAEYPAYPFHIFETVATVPETTGWENSHGHWSLELFRPKTMNITIE